MEHPDIKEVADLIRQADELREKIDERIHHVLTADDMPANRVAALAAVTDRDRSSLYEARDRVADRLAKHTAALRIAVARLDPEALSKFDAHWTESMAQARDEFSLLPGRHFIDHWWAWVAIHRRPERAARFRDCEQIVATSEDRAARRAASAELGRILADAEADAA
ncbi:DUF6247 family protein [Streptomyces blattellae]|uniref:DUF6247 family protein n=1 Tax=Streptomyces blattellae TaxID=2569855 RepID=UPI001E6334BF|nr:DUF6247 family protein [Streptomyces blattellae]